MKPSRNKRSTLKSPDYLVFEKSTQEAILMGQHLVYWLHIPDKAKKVIINTIKNLLKHRAMKKYGYIFDTNMGILHIAKPNQIDELCRLKIVMSDSSLQDLDTNKWQAFFLGYKHQLIIPRAIFLYRPSKTEKNGLVIRKHQVKMQSPEILIAYIDDCVKYAMSLADYSPCLIRVVDKRDRYIDENGYVEARKKMKRYRRYLEGGNKAKKDMGMMRLG